MMLRIRSFPILCNSQGPPKKKPNDQKLPPGPPMLPFIGNLHQLLGPTPPNQTFNNLAKQYGPIMHLKLGEVSAIVISSPEVAEEVLKTHDLTFAQRPQSYAIECMGYGSSGILLCPYGNRFKQLRKLTTFQLLGTKRVLSFKSHREEEVWNLVDSITSSRQGCSINLTEKVFSLSSSIISRAAFGNKCKYEKEFISVIKQVTELSGRIYIQDVFPSLTFLPFIDWMNPTMEKLHVDAEKIIDSIINEHKATRAICIDDAPRDEDLIDVLLKLQESNDPEFHVTSDTIKALIMEIFTAGTDTSASTIEWAMAEMLKNPEVMIKAQLEVRRELKGNTSKIKEEEIQGRLIYLKLVINETLRLHPTIILLPRESTESCEVSGYTIPRNSKVIINLQAIGRDPNFWDDPNCFKPERFYGSSINYKGSNFEYIPFGAGKRICPGISFAFATIELSLALLLYHFDWKLPNGMKPAELDMTEEFGATVKRKNDLRVIPTLVSNP